MAAPLISIIMPVKNAAFFLSDCIESIIQQTCVEWELIAVNNHSSDNSEFVLNKFKPS